jgi:hypothetical protein
MNTDRKKLQAPTSKIQRRSKGQAPKLNRRERRRGRDVTAKDRKAGVKDLTADSESRAGECE